MFTLIALIAFAILVMIVLGCIFGATLSAFVIVFGDLIVFALIVALIIKLIRRRR